MNRRTEARIFQGAVALACVVPISTGLSGILGGVAMLDHGHEVSLDSHMRYLSGLLFAIGLGFVWTLFNSAERSTYFTLLSGLVVVGGLARLYGVFVDGWPPLPMLFALTMELIVVPFLWLGQCYVTRPCQPQRANIDGETKV